jgi:transcriptional regulator with XRE-family HTH domain
VNLGEKLREAIKRKGVSQADVARHFKVKPPTVSGDWLKRGTIDKKHYPELVNYFGLPYEWWFGKSDEDAESDNRKKLLSIVDRMEEGAIGVLAQMALLIESQAQSPTDNAVDTERHTGEDRRKTDLGFDPERRHFYPAPNFPQKKNVCTDRRRKEK